MFLNIVSAASVAAVLATPGVLSAQDAPDRAVQLRVAERLAARESALIDLRHDLHRHPEVSGAEVRTARVIAAYLEDLGFEVRTGVGGHGVVGMLRGARPGPVVAFRADMDAVPSGAPDPVAYRSLVPGVRHICGHDVHVAVGLGVAEGFAAIRDRMAGSLMLIFQPAEERGTGANAMLADGVFASVTPDAVYAVHTAPYPVGQLGTVAGGMMAGRDALRVVLSGTGDLAAAADAVRAVLHAVATVGPEGAFLPAPEGYVLIQPTGDAPGGGNRVMHAMVTTAGGAHHLRARSAITSGLEAIDLPNVTVSVTYQDRVMAGVTNDSALVTRANGRIRAVLGDVVLRVEGVPPAFSEDFGSFQRHAPGVMYFLGVSNPATGTVGMPHSPDYVADDGAIVVGATAMTAILLEWLVPQP